MRPGGVRIFPTVEKYVHQATTGQLAPGFFGDPLDRYPDGNTPNFSCASFSVSYPASAWNGSVQLVDKSDAEHDTHADEAEEKYEEVPFAFL